MSFTLHFMHNVTDGLASRRQRSTAATIAMPGRHRHRRRRRLRSCPLLLAPPLHAARHRVRPKASGRRGQRAMSCSIVRPCMQQSPRLAATPLVVRALALSAFGQRRQRALADRGASRSRWRRTCSHLRRTHSGEFDVVGDGGGGDVAAHAARRGRRVGGALPAGGAHSSLPGETARVVGSTHSGLRAVCGPLRPCDARGALRRTPRCRAARGRGCGCSRACR
jgi:hypothetical protein